jgi:MscS family membrane protein
MSGYIKNRIALLLALACLAGTGALGPAAWAQQTDIHSNGSAPAEQSQKPTEENAGAKMLPETKKLDQTGEQLGKKVDAFSRSVATRIGGWIDVQLFAGITAVKLFLCLGLVFLVMVIERLARLLVQRVIRRSATERDGPRIRKHLAEALSKPLSLFIWIYGVYFALTPLFTHFRQPDGFNLVHTVAQKSADLGAAVALVWFIFRLVAIIDLSIQKWAAASESTIDDILAPLVGKTLRVFIIIVGGILIIQNLTGVEIGPLLASLGIGGLAVALAARDSIANFFGTLTILFDKPFQVGQRILIDGNDGVVETVGFRSTRIRTLTGHLLTIPNEKIVNSAVENIGMRPHIRWLNNITITYDTPPEKVEKAVSILRQILDNHEGFDPEFPPRVYFNGFNDWSLNILMIAWYHPADFWAMQEWQQGTCLEILRRFNEEGIDFAFPTQTVHLANDDARQLKLQVLKGETVTYTPD